MEPVPPMPGAPPVPATSLTGRLLNVVAVPGDVFAEIKTAAPSVANWLVPILLFIVVGVISCFVIFAQPAVLQTIHEQQVKALDKQVQQGKMTQAQENQALQLMEKFTGPTIMAVFGSFSIILGSFASVFWWALLLWLFGRWFLKTRFNYLKAVEVAGLGSVITTLGMVVGTLLVVILGRLYVGISPALLINDFDPTNRQHLLLGALNLFNLWHAGVLSVGLAKLSGASLARPAMVVFGYWALATVLLIAIGVGQWAL